jgi:hypothetical protein
MVVNREVYVQVWLFRNQNRQSDIHVNEATTSFPVRSVSFATPRAHLNVSKTTSLFDPLSLCKAVVRKYIKPCVKVGTRVAFMKTSSRDSRIRGPVRYSAASALDDIAGEVTWLLTKS